MIKVGELSGSLTNALEQAVQYLEATEALNKKLREILIPNLVQFVLLLVLAVIGTVATTVSFNLTIMFFALYCASPAANGRLIVYVPFRAALI